MSLKITNNGLKIEEVPQAMETAILDFFFSVGVSQEEIPGESQNRWHGAMTYIYLNVFKNNTYLYINPNNLTEYNYEIIDGITDIYIFLCDKYNKIANYYGISALLYIDEKTIFSWGSGKINTIKHQIYEKLINTHERGLCDRLISGKHNPVGVLGALNHYYNWSMPNVRVNAPTQQALSVNELPKLADNSNSNDNNVV